MKAVCFSEYGEPMDVLTLSEVPKPDPGPGEVLVRIRATAINDWDWSYVRGKPRVLRAFMGLGRPKQRILGAEVAGVVEGVGAGVTGLVSGDHVYGDLSEAGFGGFAEYVSTPEKAVRAMPDGMAFRDAVVLPHAGGLAVQGLLDVGRLQSGQRVLINGAGGGVGAIGLQLAKQFDAEVTGVDSAAKLQAMRDWGFDRVLDYRQHDFTELDDQYDLILDTKSTRAPGRYARALEPGGRYVTVGGELPRLLQVALLGKLLGQGKRAHVVALRPNQGLEHVCQLYETGRLQLPIDGPYRLDEVPEQLARFGRAEHLGKIVIDV